MIELLVTLIVMAMLTTFVAAVVPSVPERHATIEGERERLRREAIRDARPIHSPSSDSVAAYIFALSDGRIYMQTLRKKAK